MLWFRPIYSVRTLTFILHKNNVTCLFIKCLSYFGHPSGTTRERRKSSYKLMVREMWTVNFALLLGNFKPSNISSFISFVLSFCALVVVVLLSRIFTKLSWSYHGIFTTENYSTSYLEITWFLRFHHVRFKIDT